MRYFRAPQSDMTYLCSLLTVARGGSRSLWVGPPFAWAHASSRGCSCGRSCCRTPSSPRRRPRRRCSCSGRGRGGFPPPRCRGTLCAASLRTSLRGAASRMTLSLCSILSFSREISSCRFCLCRSPGAGMGREGGFLATLGFDAEEGVFLDPVRRRLLVGWGGFSLECFAPPPPPPPLPRPLP